MAFESAVMAAGVNVSLPEMIGGKRWQRTLKSYGVVTLTARLRDERKVMIVRRSVRVLCIMGKDPRVVVYR